MSSKKQVDLHEDNPRQEPRLQVGDLVLEISCGVTRPDSSSWAWLRLSPSILEWFLIFIINVWGRRELKLTNSPRWILWITRGGAGGSNGLELNWCTLLGGWGWWKAICGGGWNPNGDACCCWEGCEKEFWTWEDEEFAGSRLGICPDVSALLDDGFWWRHDVINCAAWRKFCCCCSVAWRMEFVNMRYCPWVVVLSRVRISSS